MVDRLTKPHILIVGSGSVGKRHARNLSNLGCRISCIDPRLERQKELTAETPVIAGYGSIDEASKDKRSFDGVVVASPPVFHVDQASIALDWGLPVLLEKPVSPDLKSALKLKDKVKKSNLPVILGYTWRWWEPLRYVRQLLAEKAVGRILFVQCVMSAHLSDWHPWEKYQDFFMAKESLGGGALLDESHWLDLMIWFFGMPKRLFARIEKTSSLDIETDDSVNLFAEYGDNLRVSVHLDLFGRPHEKYISFVGENGTIRWSADPNQVAIGRSMEQKWERVPYVCERNDMFIAEEKEFLKVLRGNGDTVETCSIDDGIRVLQLIEAARLSHTKETTVVL